MNFPKISTLKTALLSESSLIVASAYVRAVFKFKNNQLNGH